jgi:hypothetical protein
LEFLTLKIFFTYLPLKQRGANRPSPIGKRVNGYQYNIAKKEKRMIDQLEPGKGIGWLYLVDSVKGKWAASIEDIVSSVFIQDPSAIKPQAGYVLYSILQAKVKRLE